MPHHVFLHVPKTAGSSLRTVLSRHYGARHVLYFDLGAGDRRSMPEIAAALRSRMAGREIRLITGHQFLGLHEALREPCLYFSMLRDPVERVLSEYFYAFTYPHHAQREEIVSGRLSPMAFLTGPRHGGGDAQARQLAGRSARPVLEAALANLESSIAAIGIAEEFDRSLLLMARRLGWAPPLYIARNVTKLSPEQAALRQAARREAAAHRHRFATDIALHEAARARFEAGIAAEGAAFTDAYAAFARCQAALASGGGAQAGEKVFERYEFHGDDELPPWAAAIRASEDYRRVADFLARPPTPAMAPRNIMGRLDRLADGVLHGWALDLLALAPVTVHLMAGAVPVAATRAQLARPDLAQAGLGGGHCAFRLTLPAGMATRNDLRLVVAGTNIALPDPEGLLG
jgi:hypothetical protein